MAFYRNALCAAALSVPLMLGLPAFAQQTPPAPPAAPNMGEMRMERREFREEREQIRAEHERLEAEADQLKTQCMNAKGQDRSECETRHNALKEQKEALHARWQALHDKMAASGMPLPDHGRMHPTEPPAGGNAPPLPPVAAQQ